CLGHRIAPARHGSGSPTSQHGRVITAINRECGTIAHRTPRRPHWDSKPPPRRSVVRGFWRGPMAETRERLRGVVEKIAHKPLPGGPEASLFESGLLDSFMLADLVGAIEEEFAIKVPDSDLNPRKFDSIARMENYLANRA